MWYWSACIHGADPQHYVGRAGIRAGVKAMYGHTVDSVRYHFQDLRTLLAKATPARSGDFLAGLAAGSAEERVAAQMALADLPLATFLDEAVVPYEMDEVTRLILDSHDALAFRPVAHLTVGAFREWLAGFEVTLVGMEACHGSRIHNHCHCRGILRNALGDGIPGRHRSGPGGGRGGGVGACEGTGCGRSHRPPRRRAVGPRSD
jgi:hypothetical protein